MPTTEPDDDDRLAVARWRLVLGRFADPCLGGAGPCAAACSGGAGRRGELYERMDRALDYLYGREYADRGVRDRAGDRPEERQGGPGGSVLTIPDWLHEVREVFPRETVEVIERHALDRYGMTDLVTDEEVLRKIEPSYELLKAVLSFRHLMRPKVADVARRIVRQVVDELRRKLAREVRRTLWGRLSRQRRSRSKASNRLDFHRTIRDNLKHYDAGRKRLIPRSLTFHARVDRHLPWHVIVAVDCSGSMLDSIIHSAVMAGVLHGLPSFRVSLVAFDTSVVDMTGHVADPVEVLMGVHLGGGTDIAGALGYCERLVVTPGRTLVIVVTDFFEGGSPERLAATVRRLREAGVRVLGLAALDERAEPSYDRAMAARCADAGAEIAALTPGRLAEWMARVFPLIPNLAPPSPLRAALAAFDDDAFAALANRGLVRRARKDLDAAPPRDVREADGRIRITLDDAEVELAWPVSASTCSCPAEGVCRHILAGLIHVKESALADVAAAEDSASAEVGSSTAPVAADEILEVDDATLARWAGKATVARAWKVLGQGLPVVFREVGGTWEGRLVAGNVACRWIPGRGLEGMICSCHAPRGCEHRVAAVLAFQVERGIRARPEPVAAAASAEAPRTRPEVLAAVGRLVAELAALGTSRVGRSSAERFRTLAASAHGVDLPLLERLLNALAAEVEFVHARAAQAETARVLTLAARVATLARALERRPTAGLVGSHRAAYLPVGQVELVGLGARRWRTPGGYAGLTVYFRDRSADAWASWTEARPVAQGGLDPQARYGADGPWTGLDSPARACRSVLRLSDARRSLHGRLSGRSATRAIVIGPTRAADLAELAVRRWSALGELAARAFGGGFAPRNEHDELVLLEPSAWYPAAFDPVRQELVRPVVDADGRALALVVPHAPENEDALRALESIDPDSVALVLGLLRLAAGRLRVEPLAFHSESSIRNLTLDGAPARRDAIDRVAGAAPAAPAEADDPADPGAEGPAMLEESSTRLGLFLARLRATLEEVGEGGVAAFRSLAELRRSADLAGSVGLAACHRPLVDLVEHLDRLRRGDDAVSLEDVARRLLRAYDVVRLAATHEAIIAAAEVAGEIP